MIKKIVMFSLVMLLFLSFTVGKVYASQELLENGGFETLDGTLPAGWHSDSWNKDGNAKFYVANQGAHSGSSFVIIENTAKDDAKLVQTIKVKPDTVYELSCWIKTEAVDPNAKGANISVLGIFETSKDFTGNTKGWQLVRFYGKTSKDQNEIQVAVRLGGYGSLNTGKASFDDFSITEIKDVPKDVKVINFYSQIPDNATKSTEVTKIEYSKIFMYAGIFFLLLLACFKLINKKENFKLTLKKEKIVLIAILAAALLLRVIAGVTINGYSADIGCFKAWASLAATKGLPNFYISKVFADYPPGYIYVLYIIGKLQMLFSILWDSNIMLILLKLPAIGADILSSYLIYRISKKRLGNGLALILCALYALNPAIIINSSAWGQIDSFFTLFILWMVLLCMEERLLKASLIFTLAVLIKPQALIFTPILLFAFYKKKDVKIFVLSTLSSLILFIILILPYSIHQNAFWIIGKYKDTLASYPYGSLNAFNFFALIGGNWTPNSNKLFLLSYSTWGLIFTLLIVIFSTYVFLKSEKAWKLTYIAFFIITAVFMLSTKMHERYLFPALLLSIMWYIFSKDKGALYLYAAFSITHYINVAYVLECSQKSIFQISRWDWILVFTSLINLVLFVWTIKIGLEYCKSTIEVSNKVHKTKKAPKADIREASDLDKFNLIKKDYMLIAILVIIYSIIAFINLGSTKVPQSFWKPAQPGESFYVDLGESKDISKVSYYIGLGDGSYNISFSEDKANWQNSTALNQTNIYNWNNVQFNLMARYIKITVVNPGGMLNEIGIFGRDQKVPYAINSLTEVNLSQKDEGTPRNVFDEQKFAKADPSFLTGMIFDEIYHARTAYETLHRMQPFEWTHPPFGKILMSIGVLIFGMNPFGWRIIGTLFGIIMIPCMYMLGKAIFKKTEFAFLAAFLMTFDFMHFTQTRIGTVDVFAVFFIILMYYFMYRFISIKNYRDNLKKSLIYIALSGVSFAFAAATKWIGLYAAVGLAIIFFKEMYDRCIEYKYAKEYVNTKKSSRDTKKYEICKQITEKFMNYNIKTVIWSIMFFILVPFIIYILSYIPFMLVPGPGHSLTDVFRYQGYMYKYHSTLVATHPFESPWYQWPFIIMPMWYYSGQAYLPPNKISSIVAMGNPAIWWVGTIATAAVFVIGIKKKDKIAFFILVGALSQYLPWILVTRLTFIYHYFATLPFTMLCIVYLAAYYYDKNKHSKYYIYGYMLLVVLLFIMFYPVISGMIVDKSYVEKCLRWFGSWFFYS